jgi:hypothetical protein
LQRSGDASGISCDGQGIDEELEPADPCNLHKEVEINDDLHAAKPISTSDLAA